MGADQNGRHRVALEGFSAFERSALASYFRLAASRHPAYEQVESRAAAHFIIADADHPGAIDAVLAADRAGDTVFIGAHAPEGAMAWMMRPIDPLHVLRELDASVALREPQGAHVAVQPAHARRPAEPAAAATTPARRASDGPIISPRPARPRSADVLVVDAETASARGLEAGLEALGLRSERALDSGQALERLRQRSFGFVLIDVDLGDGSDLDGLSLCRNIKTAAPTGGSRAPAVILMSARADAVDRVRGTLAGCDVYLAKPADVHTLRQALVRCGAALLRREVPSETDAEHHHAATAQRR